MTCWPASLRVRTSKRAIQTRPREHGANQEGVDLLSMPSLACRNHGAAVAVLDPVVCLARFLPCLLPVVEGAINVV